MLWWQQASKIIPGKTFLGRLEYDYDGVSAGDTTAAQTFYFKTEKTLDTVLFEVMISLKQFADQTWLRLTARQRQIRLPMRSLQASRSSVYGRR